MRNRAQILVATSLAALLAAALAFQPAPRQAKAQGADTGFSQAILLLETIYGSGFSQGAPRLNATSGNVAAGVATATLAAISGKMNYITGWDVDGGGATGAAVIDCTVTGLAGGTEHRTVPVPAGATAGLTPLRVRYPVPQPASAVNVAIAASCPSFGAGNTNATVNLYGFSAQQ